MPRVSIGLPVYNGERYLVEAIESILAQTYTDLELIICDNASTDATPDICLGYAREDARIRYLRNDCNIGAAANYNRVFEEAGGEFFKWAAHDDLCAPLFVQRCVETLDRASPDVVLCYSQARLINAKGDFLGLDGDRMTLQSGSPSSRLRLLLRNVRVCNAVFGLIRRNVLAGTRLIGAFPGSDQVLLAELALRGKFVELPEPLFCFRIHAESSLRANGDPSSVAEWFDPRLRGHIALPRTRRFCEHARSILSAPLGWLDKLDCLQVVLDERLIANRQWRTVAGELKAGMKQHLRVLCEARLGRAPCWVAEARIVGDEADPVGLQQEANAR